MLKKEKEKFYAITIVAALIGIILVWQGIFASRMAIGDKIWQIQDKKASIGVYSQREETFPIISDNYNSAKEKINEVNERFVSGTISFGKFFGDMENIAFDASVSLEKDFIENPEVVKSPPKKNATKAVESPAEEDKFLRLTINGKYANLMDFISKLETMPYYIDIKSVNITAGAVSRQNLSEKKNNSEGDLQSIVIVKVFKKQNIQ